MEEIGVKQAALRYLQRGFSIIPLRPRGKAPVGEWEDKEYTEADVALFKPVYNLGLKLGTRYRGGLLVCVDLDWPEAKKLASWLLETHPSRLYDAAGGQIGHIFYVTEKAESRRFSFSAAPEGRRAVIVELLGRGKYVVVPPSVREDGTRRVWIRDGEPGRVDYDDLIRALRVLAAACILGTVWRRGYREDAALALAGALWRRGWDAASAKRLIEAICKVADDEEAEKRLRCVDDTFNGGRAVNRTGIPRLKAVLDPAAVTAALGLLDITEPELGGSPPPDRPSQRVQALFEAIRAEGELFRDISQRTFIVLRTERGRRTWPIASTEFEDYVTRKGWELGFVPGTEHIKKIARLLRSEAPESAVPVFTRAARLNDRVYVQLGRERFLEISPGGYRSIPEPPVRFLTLYNMQELPDPVPGGSIDALRELINVDDADWLLIKIFMLAAFNTPSTFPVLFITGYQGTGKTTAAWAIKNILDPTTQGVRASVERIEDLFIAARHEHVLVFDNVSHISDTISDAFCTIVDGITFTRRTLYTNFEESMLYSHNPIVITAIEECITRPDLLDRTFIVETRPNIVRQVGADLWAGVERVRAEVLGALFDAVAAALRREGEMRLTTLPRLAGVAKWAAAAADLLGTTPEEIIDILLQNRSAVAARLRDSDPIYTALVSVFEDLLARAGAEVNVSTTELYRELRQRVDGSVLYSKDFPMSPDALGRRLRRLAPVFEADGFQLYRARSRAERFWVIKRCSGN